MSLCAKMLFPGRLQMIKVLAVTFTMTSQDVILFVMSKTKQTKQEKGKEDYELLQLRQQQPTVCAQGSCLSLHTLATYTQVKCPSTNKEIFILWMVFFFIVQKIYKTTTLFQDIKSTLNSMCRLGALMCILCSVHIWFVSFYFGTILSAICMHIFTVSAKHINLN